MSKSYKNFERCKIEYEDDIVIVYDENGKLVYRGIEDYEPMKDENWQWDNNEKLYRFENYIKICIET